MERRMEEFVAELRRIARPAAEAVAALIAGSPEFKALVIKAAVLVILFAAVAGLRRIERPAAEAVAVLIAASPAVKALAILAAALAILAAASAGTKAVAILASASAAAGFAYIYRREIKKAVRRNPDVFLNFCGQDIQNGLADYLSIKLLDAKFSAFKDDCEQIGPGLSWAIKNSDVAICIISKNCGGSDRFLATLSQIMCRHAEQGLLVLPIFYEVDVSDVRDQTGEFGRAFSELANPHAPEQVEEWKEALNSLARIMGWSSWDFATGHQAPLVNKVVDKVSSILSPPWIERIPMFRKKRRAIQVFLLSSPATTKNFTCHLHNGLVSEKTSVFGNDDQSLIGKDFDHEVCNAMYYRDTFIVVISEDFASSRDRLDKLTQILISCRRNGPKILPVFYEVHPLQNQEVWDHIQNDMMQHDVPQDTRQQWEDTLECIRSIPVLALENFRDWQDLVQHVRRKIRNYAE